MYFYPNPYFYQYSPQLLFVQPPIDAAQDLNNNCLNQNQNFKRIGQENNSFNFDIKIEEVNNKCSSHVSSTKLQKVERAGMDSDYEPQKSKGALFYKNKNTQTNLSNQIFSFFSSEKSEILVLRLFEGNGQKKEQFYKLMKKIKKSNRKYMNRTDIIDLVKLRQGTPSFRIYKKSKCTLQIQELKQILRVTVLYFVRNACNITLLTSKKMNKNTLREHLQRKREFEQYFTKQMTTSS